MRNQDITNTLEAAVNGIRRYDYGSRRTAVVELERRINATHGNREARQHLEKAMATLLRSDAPAAAKQLVCKKLWIIGVTAVSLSALEELLTSGDLVLTEAACFAIGHQPSEAADRALRRAAAKASGKALAAIVNLQGDRRDAAAAPRLIELMRDADPLVVDAAIAALGKIASPESLAALRKVHASHALLQSAQELARRGDRRTAREIYEQLSGGAELPQIRRGAQLALARLA
jgi:hypothetical protein